MRYLSVFRSVETDSPPSEQEMAAMGALIEKFTKSGHLAVVDDGECEVRQLWEEPAL